MVQNNNHLIENVEIPKDIQDILFLKCFKSDFVAVVAEAPEKIDLNGVDDDMLDDQFDDDMQAAFDEEFSSENESDDDVDYVGD